MKIVTDEQIESTYEQLVQAINTTNTFQITTFHDLARCISRYNRRVFFQITVDTRPQLPEQQGNTYHILVESNTLVLYDAHVIVPAQFNKQDIQQCMVKLLFELVVIKKIQTMLDDDHDDYSCVNYRVMFKGSDKI